MAIFGTQPGPHFQKPSLLSANTIATSLINNYAASAGVTSASTTTQFFTNLAAYGVQDQTNWTAATYKTIYSHTGSGLIYGMIACTAGGAETTTFEITIDGILSTITVTNANLERAVLIASGAGNGTDFTTASIWPTTNDAGLDAGTLTTFQSSNTWVWPSMRWFGLMGVSLLQYNISCLIRMKHSASITNSTATAYSGVMVRKGIAA